MKNKTKGLFGVVLLLAAVGFGGYRVWQAYQAKAESERPQASRGGGSQSRVVTVSVAQARTGSVKEDIEVTGALKPKEQVDITSKVTGRVEQLNLQVGDYVQRGQKVAELEVSELAQQVRRAEAAQAVVKATLAQRRAELSNARGALDRAKQLMDAGLIPRQDYDTALTNFRVVESQVALTNAQGEQALAELNELKIRLEQMTITAPMSGYVAQRYVDVGAVVSPSTPIIKLVNLSTLVTMATVPERVISKVRVGNKANVTVDAFGDQVFEGRIARISPVLDAATRTAFVEVEIPNRNGQLKAEMFARVKLDLGTTRDAVLIPREALVYRGQQPGVFVVQDSKRPTFQRVETGNNQGAEVEVLGNLAAGTTVVSRGAAMLNEGDQIRVMEQKEAEHLQPVPSSSRPAKRSSLTSTDQAAELAG